MQCAKALTQTAWARVLSPPHGIRAWFSHLSNGDNSIDLRRLLFQGLNEIVYAKCFVRYWHIISTQCVWVKEMKQCPPHRSAKTPRSGERKHITASKARAEIPKPVRLVTGTCPSPVSCTCMWDCLVCTPLSPRLPYSHVHPFCVELCRRLSVPSTPSSTFRERRHLSLMAIPPITLRPLPTRSSDRPRSVTPLWMVYCADLFFRWSSTYSDKSSCFVVPSLLLFYFLTHPCLDFRSKTWALENHNGEKIHL